VLGYQGTLTPDPERLARATGAAEELSWAGNCFLEPSIASALQDLGRRISAGQRVFEGEPIDCGPLVEALRERLSGILAQVLALDPEANEEKIARRFPALPALLAGAAAEWVDAVAVFHSRLHRDRSRLVAWLGEAKLPGLASLTPARSDAHAGGHIVLRLLFRDGRSIYYKPRPVSGEWLWDRLIQAVNAHSSLQLPSAEALAGATGRYGWVASLLPHTGLQDREKGSAHAAPYWRGSGATLCLAAQVRMTDLHMANVMATCQGPAPVDAESLGTPQTVAATLTRRGPEPAIAAFIDNLLETGLLPDHSAGDLPDVSGLFGRAAAVPEILVPRWSAGPCGARGLQLAPAALLDHGNAPPGVSPLEVLPLLVDGYREAAAALVRCRDALASPASEWRWTLEHLHAPRIVLRDTLTYGLLLSESLAPDQLQSVQHRRCALRRALGSRSPDTFPEAVLRTEARSLLELQIPRFTALPGSRRLAGNSGRALAQRFLSCSPAEAALGGIGELSPQRISDVHIPGLRLAVLGQHDRH
jgi:lantibiotic modifying enzyme